MKGKMLNNYWGQLIKSYPERAEVLEWMKYFLDNRMYYYGNNFLCPYEARPHKIEIRKYIYKLYTRIRRKTISYEDSVISNAYFNVSSYIKEEGLKVVPPPWETNNMSKESQETIYQMEFSDFNKVVSDSFSRKVYCLKDELKDFFLKNNTPFLLLSNDLVPIHRIAIDVCRELGIASGIFLHGLPARYNSIDDSRADYLFVWGEKIRDNYLAVGSQTSIVVVGHPNLSSIKIEKKSPQNVVVLSRAINGAPSSSDHHQVDERGICIQHIFAVESALKNVGVNKAILRIHPSENPDWYARFMDTDFYRLDNTSLYETLSHAKMVVGHISTVMLDTVLNNIPCYPFVIDENQNIYADEIVPPFCNKNMFPTATSIEELSNNIKSGRCVTKEHFEGYVSPVFDVKKLAMLIRDGIKPS